MSSSTQQPSAPRFSRGQRVRIIANEGGLYAAQIGVVGVISKQRQKRTYGDRRYDVTYQDAKGREKIVSVREDDLVAVSPVADWLDDEPEPAPYDEPTPPAAPTKPEKPAKPAKTPEQPPLFSKGERVTVHPHSALAYETFTRHGAVGVIMHDDRPVRGIRRYQVLFEDSQTGGRRATRIREEHLLRVELRVEPPAEPEPTPPLVETVIETAYVERSDGELVKREQIVLFTCPRDGSGPGCAHDWQVWPDGRYRICLRCKLSERVEVAP